MAYSTLPSAPMAGARSYCPGATWRGEGRLGGRDLHVLVDARPQAAVREGGVAGQHVVEGTAQGIDVAADVGGGTVPGLLGGQVVDGADRAAGPGHAELLLVDRPGQAE